MAPQGYEDAFSRPARWMRRIQRFFTWRLKGLFGLPRGLLVELRWRLGDELMATPIFESLRARYPTAHIAVLSNYPELFENHPFVDSVNAPPRRIDRFLCLRGAPRTTFRLAYLSRRAKVALPVWRPYLYFTDWRSPVLDRIPPEGGPLIALAAESTWKTKAWRPERWQALRQALETRGGRVIELGLKAAVSGAALNLVGQTSVRDAACLLHAADLLISVDCGLMHLALAATTPVIALFGPTDPDILIQGEALLHPIRSTAPCHGYWNRPGPQPDPNRCPEGCACCLETITVEEVLEAVDRVLPTLGRRG